MEFQTSIDKILSKITFTPEDNVEYQSIIDLLTQIGIRGQDPIKHFDYTSEEKKFQSLKQLAKDILFLQKVIEYKRKSNNQFLEFISMETLEKHLQSFEDLILFVDEQQPKSN